MGAVPELNHVAKARSFIGTTEIKGEKHNPKIIDFWEEAENGTDQNINWLFKNAKKNDEVAWCGGFMGGVFSMLGLGGKIPKNFFRAQDWAKAGTKLDKPAYGCVAVLQRPEGGHVALVVGKTKDGKLKLLGGNQSDQVNIMDFDPSRVIAYRWISTGDVPAAHRYDLPVLDAGKVSKNEA